MISCIITHCRTILFDLSGEGLPIFGLALSYGIPYVLILHYALSKALEVPQVRMHEVSHKYK